MQRIGSKNLLSRPDSIADGWFATVCLSHDWHRAGMAAGKTSLNRAGFA
jgi:hypothetical protein